MNSPLKKDMTKMAVLVSFSFFSEVTDTYGYPVNILWPLCCLDSAEEKPSLVTAAARVRSPASAYGMGVVARPKSVVSSG